MIIPFELDNSISFNINRVAVLLRRELKHALSEYELSPEQWQIMVTLWSMNKALSQKDIALLTLSDKHSISRMIDRLYKKGWIQRTNTSQDGRLRLIIASEWSIEISNKVKEKVQSQISTRLSNIPETERKYFLSVLKKLRSLLNE